MWTVDRVFRTMAGADLNHWSVQGFGMLRLYVSPTVRINVWDPSKRIRPTITPHDHPWGFTSTVVVGSLVDQRYELVIGGQYVQHTITCGEVPELLRSVSCGLVPRSAVAVTAGESYHMDSTAIHWSDVAPGTVTVLEKSFRLGPDTAHIYLPPGEEWVTVKARPARMDEVLHYLDLAQAARDYVPV